MSCSFNCTVRQAMITRCSSTAAGPLGRWTVLLIVFYWQVFTTQFVVLYCQWRLERVFNGLQLASNKDTARRRSVVLFETETLIGG